MFYHQSLSVPRIGVEPTRLSTLAPETSASTISPPGLGYYPISDCKYTNFFSICNLFRKNHQKNASKKPSLTSGRFFSAGFKPPCLR